MWNLKKFEEVYSRYLSSGLRVKDFCQNECLHVSRFFYWQRKLKEYQREHKESSGFVPLLFHQSGNPLKSSIDFQSFPHTSKAEDVCELVYPNGVKLRIPLDTDIRKVEQLILLCR